MSVQELDKYSCANCGAPIKYKPGTQKTVCQYCGTENNIREENPAPVVIQENNLHEFLNNFERKGLTMEAKLVKCTSCAAEVTLQPGLTSDNCPFCDTPLIIQNASVCQVHRPQYLLPFRIDEKTAKEKFGQWIGNLWFAPNNLQKYKKGHDKMNAMYLPYWTYDCQTVTAYRGERGMHYYETQTVQETVDGKTVTRQVQVRKTRWTPVSGVIRHSFDDVLVPATRSLPANRLNDLEPWNTQSIVPFDSRFLAGIRTEQYQISLSEGYTVAKRKMEDRIEQRIYQDIGGDEQRITSKQTDYLHPTFKHILLPVWVSAFRYNGKAYQFIVNAQTGEVQGERPYSIIKIALVVLLVLAVIGLYIYFTVR